MAKSSNGPPNPKASKNKATDSSPASLEPQIPHEMQLQLLKIFKDALPTLSNNNLETTNKLLQEVKQALYERDFERAFGRQEYLEAYAFRWSPSRALCYASILIDLRDHLSETSLFRSSFPDETPNLSSASEDGAGASGHNSPFHAACLGGGAAEVVAFGGLVKHLLQYDKPSVQETQGQRMADAIDALSTSIQGAPMKKNFLFIDTAAWDNVVQKLTQGLMTPPLLSKYASASAKAANTALLPAGSFTTTFHQANLLDMEKEQLQKLLGQNPMLITLLFTLNELYTSSITKTTAFLLTLTAVVQQGTVLLVVDSPGSYSEAVVGKDAKKYPMQWLLDRTLLGKQDERGEEDGAEWEKLVSDDSRWFRLLENLKYPISLENMRYQLHLFRRL